MGAKTPQETRSSSAHKPHVRPPLTAPGPGDYMIRSRENRWATAVPLEVGVGCLGEEVQSGLEEQHGV